MHLKRHGGNTDLAALVNQDEHMKDIEASCGASRASRCTPSQARPAPHPSKRYGGWWGSPSMASDPRGLRPTPEPGYGPVVVCS